MPLLTIEPAMPVKAKRLAFGIDLGTTHSLIAYEQGGSVHLLQNERGEKLLPSAVRYLPSGDVIVGSHAKAAYAQDPKNTILSVKRLLGRSAAEIPHSVYDFVADQSHTIQLQTVVGSVNPLQVSSEILKTLWRYAQQVEPQAVEAVITVPAYFDEAQRQATKDAARLAGIKVLRLLNEPTAAAIAYGLDKGARGLCLIFDLGGGTFDVSLLQLTNGVFEVLATGGDTALGGDDMDSLVAQWILEQAGLSSAHFPEVLLVARQAKETLSDKEVAVIDIAGWQGELSRTAFNQLISSLVERTIAICQRLLKDAHLTPDAIDHIVLVGGATRTQLVRQQVAQYFAKEPLNDINPDEVVAMGAAIQASLLVGNRRDDAILLLDVIPLSLGLELLGGLTEKILLRHTPIPAKATQTFTTQQEGQTGLSLHIVQGERELAKDNRSLAHFDLMGLPPLPAGQARIEVTFQVDEDGLLSVTAQEVSTNITSTVEVKPTYGLTPEAVTALIEDSILHADEDIVRRKQLEKRLEAEQLLTSLQKMIASDGDLLSPPQCRILKQTMQQLEMALKDEIWQEVRSLMKMLEVYAQDFAQLRLDHLLEQTVLGKTVADLENLP